MPENIEDVFDTAEIALADALEYALFEEDSQKLTLDIDFGDIYFADLLHEVADSSVPVYTSDVFNVLNDYRVYRAEVEPDFLHGAEDALAVARIYIFQAVYDHLVNLVRDADANPEYLTGHDALSKLHARMGEDAWSDVIDS